MAVSDYDPLIESAAHEWNIDPNWVRAIMQQESGGNRFDKNGRPLRSPAGAGGLMQIMPGTAEGLSPGMDVDDPQQAIYGGSKLLSQLLDKYGNPVHATMAYNARPSTVDAYLAGKGDLPAETKAYVPAVSAHYQRFAKVDQTMAGPRVGATSKPTPAPSDIPSDEDFLKSTGAVSPKSAAPGDQPQTESTSVPADDDFLKMTGASAPKAKTVAAETPNDISGAGRDEYGNPVSPLAQAPPLEGDAAPIVRALSSGQGMRDALMPAPGYVRAPIPLLPLAWKETTPGSGVIDPNSGLSGLKFDPGAAVAPLVNPVLDLLEGTGLETSMGGQNAPLAGKVSPAATMLMLGARAGNPNPLQSRASIMSPLGRDIQLGAPEARIPSPGDLRLAPLSPEFRTSPLASDARVAVTNQTPIPNAPSTQTGIPLVARPGETGAPLNATLPVNRDIAPVSDGATPTTSVAAKQIAGAYYKKADDAGGTLSPDFTNKFIDRVKSAAPQTSEGQIVAGENPVTQLVDRMQALRDNPISLAGAQEIDEGLGNLIDKEYGPRGLSKDGKNLQDLQTTFRNMIQDAGPSDITGGKEGFAALSDARKAWAQAMKMSDLERIVTRASMTDNPATGIKSGIRTLLSNPARSRGYSPEEISALKDAADRGILGGALHVFGSRLIPLAAGGAAFGASTGFLPAMAVAGATHLGSSLLRAGATGLQSRRMKNALSVLGSGVPPAP